MTSAIAIVGMACQYPDARSPIELWENVLAQRRAFRRLPSERLNLPDYLSPDRNAPDCTYATEAALIEGYEFDRVGFRVAGSTFRSADLVHWLALDIAAQALADAGFPEGESLPRDSTGVLLGNTLTGEFSRANTMRLRWPFVRRVVEAALLQEDWSPEQRLAFLKNLEAQYKAPFPEIGEESLAGSLANTIAGRICNHFNLKGGGYTVDGACSSSLLAVANACSALVAGDLDVALAGGVDLSLDPFELVGFAKAGALAPEEMRVYDTRSAGFLPGEGCGFVVLMRYEDAVAQCRRIYTVIRGWGISSDGSGGITRPEVEGQLLALHHAYRRAGFGIDTVAYFEGHGTGTSVGDATELRALSRARQEALLPPLPSLKRGVGEESHTPSRLNPNSIASKALPAVIGSIKANIGHTKAAAGVAGLIKATMALHTQILPPTTGCEQPHPELTGENPALQVLSEGQSWPDDQLLRAGVSAMGFGGINAHIVLEGTATEQRQILSPQERTLLSSAQDAELLLINAQNTDELQQQVEHLLTLAPKLSRAELTDLAAELERTLDKGGTVPVRAALLAASPKELTSRLELLSSWLKEGVTNRLDISNGVFLGTGINLPLIGFLFPGQASPTYLNGKAWARRFQWVRQLYDRATFPTVSDDRATAVAQPAIVTASMAGLRTLEQLGVVASIAVGHSLGELTALHWAGALDEDALLRIATIRGKAMAQLSSPTGAMASIRANEQEVKGLLNGKVVVIAGLNSPDQTVISGQTEGVAAVVARAADLGFKTVNLPVSHAFHSPLVAAATQPLAKHLATEDFRPLKRTVVSTVTGSSIAPDEDLRSLLIRQVTAPVRFIEAASKAVENVDLLIEVGSGRVLSGLVTEFVNVPTVALDAGSSSLKGLLQAIGAAFALGAPINHKALFVGRFTRSFNLDWQPRFFVNPCELAPISESVAEHRSTQTQEDKEVQDKRKNATNQQFFPPSPPISSSPHSPASPLDLVRQLVAERAELPPSAVKDNNRLLSDLHLNSITVGQLVAEASRSLGLAPPVAPTHYADATVAEVAQALEELVQTGGSTVVDAEKRSPSGVDSWIRAFTVELVERPLPRRQLPIRMGNSWRIIAPAAHPLAGSLQEAFEHSPGSGVVVCLPPEPDESHIDLLLEGVRAVLAERESTRFVLVQHGGGGAAIARTLHLEAPKVTTCVVDVPIEHPQATEWVLAEALTAVGYSEAQYDSSGRRLEPRLRLLPILKDSAELPLGQDDVLLVTGGGKGIAAECALSLARETGVRLALLGRSQPDSDSELSTNLDRMTTAGVHVRYIAADVTDAEAVQVAVSKLEADLGSITAIVHGAGVNVPQLLTSLDKKDFLCTLAPKVQGVRNVLAAINPEQLRLFITFGSIIARTGLPGEADYALANEWLARLTERFHLRHPNCRCLSVEWSIWSGVGMGDRLGRVDALMREGITPISPDAGISILRQLVAQPLPATSVIVTGRFGEAPTLKVEQPELPFRRFLENKRVYYPGVELVVDVELSTDTDPYLNDHVFQGERIFPGVMGLEAIAQVAMALLETSKIPVFEDVQFNRPIVVSDASPLTIRIAALVRESGKVEVVLRSEQTGFGVDHFRATCLLKSQETGTQKTTEASPNKSRIPNSLNPQRDLYGDILFHKGRFQRLQRYHHLRATECLAEISEGDESWFSRYLPQALILGDPGARDATIHALQACVPHTTILPNGIERLEIYEQEASGTRFVSARERQRIGDTFIYDLEVIDKDEKILERWHGLQLRVIQYKDTQSPWVAPLLAPYLERRLREFIPTADVTVIVDKDSTVERRVRSDRSLQLLTSSHTSIARRPDGKPELTNGKAVSVAHAGDLTLVVSSSEGCDVELVESRTPVTWRDLLGVERFTLANLITQQMSEGLDTAATRVWAVSECNKKAGAIVNAPLTLVEATADGVVWLKSGENAIASFAVSVWEFKQPLVFTVLVRKVKESARILERVRSLNKGLN